jgi:hypothetical protein
MAFLNSLECHFSKIKQTPEQIDVTVRIYQVSDGGTDGQGNQQYNRTLVVTRDYTIDPNQTKQQLVSRFLTELSNLNTEFNLNYSPQRFICTL